MTIDAEKIRRLLGTPEGPSLDFKRDQYPFVGATEREKSELLKDILAFANTPRDETAHIVIGVEERPDGTTNVVGIASHHEDSDLHQFVNSKTNTPVEFTYERHEYDSKQIAILRIPVQTRPVYVNKKFGIVQANAVYLRDGSSTRTASPSEIADIGRDTGTKVAVPELAVNWCDPSTRTVLGADYVHSTAELLPPERSWKILELLYKDDRAVTEREYRRAHERNLQRPLGLAIANSGTTVATAVQLTIDVPKHTQITISPTSIPGSSQRSSRGLASSGELPIEVINRQDRYELVVNVERIRPGETVWAGNGFRIGVNWNGALKLRGVLIGDNLPKQVDFELPLRVERTKRQIRIEEFPKVDMGRSTLIW